jgi:hypothetical protein
MGRPVLLLVGAAAFAGVVLAYGAFAWVETERRVVGAAEAEGRAVLESVRAGVDASAAVDQLLRKRLEDLADRLDKELADEPDAPKDVAQRFVKEHALAGVVVLDQSLAVRGAASRRGESARAASDALNVVGAEGELLAAEVRKAAAKDGGWASSTSIRLGFASAPLSAAREYGSNSASSVAAT